MERYVRRSWKSLHNELHNSFASLNIIMVIRPRRMRWAENVACIETVINTYNILVGKPKGKRPLVRLMHR
jgi:hypothetical protein